VAGRVNDAHSRQVIAVVQDTCNDARRSGPKKDAQPKRAVIGNHWTAAFDSRLIRLVTGQGRVEMVAKEFGQALMVGMTMRERNHPYGATFQLTKDAIFGPAGRRVDQYIVYKICVQPLAGIADELPNSVSDQLHGRDFRNSETTSGVGRTMNASECQTANVYESP
jgi:hypothetical protein